MRGLKGVVVVLEAIHGGKRCASIVHDVVHFGASLYDTDTSGLWTKSRLA